MHCVSDQFPEKETDIKTFHRLQQQSPISPKAFHLNIQINKRYEETEESDAIKSQSHHRLASYECF